ncbi:phage coat protein [Escherichia coli]|uniref:phage coat protein n=1 Tax=Escherichia coli TaxID=562 RepID=UPI000B80086F|nr:phage coat protein [Escherichia coli]EFO0990812.1 phage coat protein [Escherichia coli]EKF3354616.1 phage coat protein [Escherichia coli]MHT60210.1 phage coat protein [Escherichia coli]NEV43738.1 phage coat protein [Escherichia coli]TXX24006.1 phage coat protein [Escherichia coli]
MRLLFLLLFLPFFSSAESFTRTFAPFKLTEADETCISRPALQGVTLSGAFRSDNTWYAVLDGCIYEATGDVIVGSDSGTVLAYWIPVAAYEPSDGDGGDGDNSSGGNGDNSSGGGNDNTVSGRVSATYLLELADALKEKECSSPTMICGSFSFASEPEEVMKLSDVRAFASYYSCIPNGSGWQSLYKSTCYLREGYKIEDGKIVPDNGNEGDNNGSEDNNSGSEGGNNSGGGNSGSDGNDNNTGNGDDGLSDEWGRKIYYLLNAGLPAIGDKIDSFHHSFITQSGITSDYLAAIDEKLGILTAQDENYAESQAQFNSTMQGIIENGISSVEQGVQDRIQELIPLIEDYVPVLNFSGIIPQGFFGNNRDVCVPLDLSFSFRPFGGEEMPFNLSTEGVCRIYDGYLREVIRFFIYVITAVSLVILVDKSLSGR